MQTLNYEIQNMDRKNTEFCTNTVKWNDIFTNFHCCNISIFM